MVHYQYSGNEHDVIAGIGLVNLLWHNLTKLLNQFLLIIVFMIKIPMKKQKIRIFPKYLHLLKKEGSSLKR
nr:hypothetical protein [Candidatus Arsenophonus triatominarum]